MTAQYRISKSAWLQTGEHPVVDAINRRVTDVTGLDMETAEELQVVNYGLGGHYEPHYDFARVRFHLLSSYNISCHSLFWFNLRIISWSQSDNFLCLSTAR